MAEKTSDIYPHFVVENNKKPNRLFAFPVIGIIIKMILLIPVFIEMFFLAIASGFLLLINWFVVLFSKTYWDTAYRFFLGLMRLTAKTKLYLFGLTDKYPWFGLDTNGICTLDIPKPEKSNIWLAIPLLGFLVRFVLLIPYLIFSEVLNRGSGIALIMSWFAVTFKKIFPESLYEFERDTLRVEFAADAYLIGLSDTYPSFAISMNHQTIKILLIIAGAILFAWSASMPSPTNDRASYQNDYQYNRSNSI